MEHRNDLEELLLSGLTEDEQHATTRSMANATTSKLSRLRSFGDAADEAPEADDLEESEEDDAHPLT